MGNLEEILAGRIRPYKDYTDENLKKAIKAAEKAATIASFHEGFTNEEVGHINKLVEILYVEYNIRKGIFKTGQEVNVYASTKHAEMNIEPKRKVISEFCTFGGTKCVRFEGSNVPHAIDCIRALD
jgi:hypothetical protein